MARKGKLGGLDDYEVSLIKGMMAHEILPTDQDILAFFSRPGRTINNGRLSEIRQALKSDTDTGKPAIDRFRPQPIASLEEVEAFLAAPPSFDSRTGLDLEKDELLIKAREAMLLAVRAFNSAGIHFKTETFIVLAMIAWTYLLLAHYKRQKIDCVYRDNQNQPLLTRHGQPKHLDLAALLEKPDCPVQEPAMKANIRYLVELRHEIEHRGTQRIDEFVSAKLQACALNFNAMIKKLFGSRCGLDHELGFAIQFARLDPVQLRLMGGEKDLPKMIQTVNLAFETTLSDEILNDPRYAYRVAIVPRAVAHTGRADAAVTLVDPNSSEGKEIALILKDREKPKFLPGSIVSLMKDYGFRKFDIYHHTTLWKAKQAKKEKGRYGTEIQGKWYWYQTWVDEVRAHCEANADKYR